MFWLRYKPMWLSYKPIGLVYTPIGPVYKPTGPLDEPQVIEAWICMHSHWINSLARESDLKTICLHREHEIGTAAARVYYKTSHI